MSKEKADGPRTSPDICLSPEWFETILCSLNDGVFCVNEDWKITCFNQAASSITGIPKEKALGMPCHEVFRSNICKGSCALRYTMETGNPLVNLMITITNSKGERKPVSISTALLKDKKGKIIGGVETFRDLSLVEQLRKQLDARYTFNDILSKSSKMQHLFDMIPTIAESDSTVLITGESGTGKDLVARAIHNTSGRHEGSFISVNCAAIPDTLLESELFGHKAGAFTDARDDKPGRFTIAEGGTIFLDEIGDIPPAIQAKLLRVLQDKVFQPLGGIKDIEADVRIVAATNKNLDQLVKDGRFRMDLFYRINVISINLPPLRERMEDVALLIDHFIARFSTLKGKDIPGISPEALGILMSYSYPGNIRELENIIEHAFVMCSGGMIGTDHLPEYMQPETELTQGSERQLVDQYEKEVILTALRKNQWNRLQTAKALGIHKTTLFRKIHKLGIVLPEQDGRSKG